MIFAALPHQSAASFNTAYYATIATVIPVLYVALTVQAQTIGALYSAGVRMATRADRKTGWRKQLPLAVTGIAATWVALVMFAGGPIAEINAIHALLDRANEAGWGGGDFELTMVALLTLTVAAIPVTPVVEVYRQIEREEGEETVRERNRLRAKLGLETTGEPLPAALVADKGAGTEHAPEPGSAGSVHVAD